MQVGSYVCSTRGSNYRLERRQLLPSEPLLPSDTTAGVRLNGRPRSLVGGLWIEGGFVRLAAGSDSGRTQTGARRSEEGLPPPDPEARAPPQKDEVKPPRGRAIVSDGRRSEREPLQGSKQQLD